MRCDIHYDQFEQFKEHKEQSCGILKLGHHNLIMTYRYVHHILTHASILNIGLCL